MHWPPPRNGTISARSTSTGMKRLLNKPVIVDLRNIYPRQLIEDAGLLQRARARLSL